MSEAKQCSNLRLCVLGHQMENCTVKMVISSLNFSVPQKSHILHMWKNIYKYRFGELPFSGYCRKMQIALEK